jgi:hypothetical protein
VSATAKFWFYAAGWVRLTLRPGKSIEWTTGHPTDEGWYSQRVRWTHVGDRVLQEWDTDSRDCDGRMSTHTECECPIVDLAGEESHGPDAPPVPKWERASYPRSRQRDYSAEASGY